MLILKASLAGCLLAISLPATAGCTYIAEVSNRTLYMEISDGGCGDLTIDFSRNIGRDGRPVPGSIKSFPFDEECVVNKDKNLYPIGLSCHPNGRTPLAGATYKRKRIGYAFDECGGGKPLKIPVFQYVCVKGCSASVPKILDERDICD